MLINSQADKDSLDDGIAPVNPVTPVPVPVVEKKKTNWIGIAIAVVIAAFIAISYFA